MGKINKCELHYAKVLDKSFLTYSGQTPLPSVYEGEEDSLEFVIANAPAIDRNPAERGGIWVFNQVTWRMITAASL